MDNCSGAQQPPIDIDAEYAVVQRFFEAGQSARVGQYLQTLAGRCGDTAYLKFLLGAVLVRMGSLQDALDMFAAGLEIIGDYPVPGNQCVATTAYLNAQLQTPCVTRPSTVRADEHLAGNLSALREVEASLADELAEAGDVPEHDFVDVWGRLHVFDTSRNGIMSLQQATREQLGGMIGNNSPVALSTVGTGQELAYCLARPVTNASTGVRVHYLFEPDPQRIRTQLRLVDCRQQLRTGELVILGGRDGEDRREAFFGTHRYLAPQHYINTTSAFCRQVSAQIDSVMDYTADKEKADRYFESDEYADRLRDIAAGRVWPRILILTSRWTTYLQYCSTDFGQAFGQWGCDTRVLIEESDAQSLTTKLLHRQMAEYKPDMVFMVSHARPSFPCVSRKVPIVSYVMDRCGRLIVHQDLEPHIGPADLLVCMVGDFVRYLSAKGVSRSQMCVLPPPANERMFYPIDDIEAIDDRFRCDVSFVKHGCVDKQQATDQFLDRRLRGIADQQEHALLVQVFADMAGTLCRGDDVRVYEVDMQEFVAQRVSGRLGKSTMDIVPELVWQFYIDVHTNWWRRYFVERLAGAGVDVALYGSGWDQHDQFTSMSRGTVQRGPELNQVYNASAINLNIHPCSSMHQRLVECALAGGFMLNASHDAAREMEPVTTYFEPGREIVMFDSADDLVEKCRYYLAHPQERRDIAERFRNKALANYTTTIMSGRILDAWRAMYTSHVATSAGVPDNACAAADGAVSVYESTACR